MHDFSAIKSHLPDPRYANPEAVANARREWAQTRDNPLNNFPVYGDNPFHVVWKQHKRPDPRIHHFPVLSDPVPPLAELAIECSELTCLQDMGGGFNSEAYYDSGDFKVRYRNQVCILKVYRSHERDPAIQKLAQHGLDGKSRFENERRVYEHLLHYGVSAKGFVPKCYGWFKLHVDEDAGWLVSFLADPIPPNAILLEYFPDASRLNVSNITVPVAQNALRSLARVHEAGIHHRDINPRNHLVLADGRVVIIDFDVALTRLDGRVNKLELKWEMESAWSLYFQVMVHVSSNFACQAMVAIESS
ncbi:hypothetical protein JAAARDRAFT_201892 [Jaapia argillacea MUCL 33604]|uniref:Protein kinase domain-containing protein n=1 Tax=Jaapia argillacea MUCL 33604 TaxID=933084 RepID=A0A067QPK2_9AGAM|nr:hypothetical protein JAAARDRAFT_201892 [Jaapia argillacea MUCL 33604]